MDDALWLKAALKTLVLPPTGLLLVALAGLALRARMPRAGRLLSVAGVVSLLILSMPVVAGLLLRFVDTAPTLDIARAESAQAIVVIGGGTRRNAQEYGGTTLATLTLERVRYGARIARLTGLPVLVSGGSVLHGEPEALLMQASLVHEFGVPVRWVEARSRTTHENAVLSAAILRRDGIGKIVLVAHGFDMRRAIAEFEAEGLATIGAPTGHRTRTGDTELLDYLPSMAGLQQSYYAAYEIVANLVLLATPNR